RNGASPNSLTSNVMIDQRLTDDRSEKTLLANFTPLSNGRLATSIDPSALKLLNTRLPGGQFLIPTPQADGHYSGSAISAYREDQFNTNLDCHTGENDWLAAKFFWSNAPQFLALREVNVPGFGADLEQNNRLVSFQDVHTFSPRTVNEARAGYSFIL